MKKKLILRIVVIGLIIAVISAFIYFVSGVSSTYPAIKKYEYLGSLDNFVIKVQNYASVNHNINVKITDTVANYSDDHTIYLRIETSNNKENIEYSLKCEGINHNKTIISLVEAYNETQNTGGYSKEAKGVENLVKEFNDSVLMPLESQQKLKLISR